MTESKEPIRLLILPIWLLAIYAFGLLIADASPICLWIICSFFLFVLLDPIVQFLKAHRWPTVVASMSAILISSLLIAATIYFLGYLVSGMILELQQSKKIFMHTFESFIATWNAWLEKLPGFHPPSTPANADVSKVEVVQGSPLGGEFGGTILHGIGNAATVFTFALLVPILSFFLLAERDGLGRVISRAYSNRDRAILTWKKIVSSTRAFFVGNLVLALVSYPLFVILFWAFSVPSIFTFAALATFLNLIPFAGALLSGFLPALALYAQTQTFGPAVGLYIFCIVIHLIIADFVTPKLLGSQVNINATTSTIALVLWGELWGGLGLVLAIPLTSLIKILFEQSDFFWLQWVAGLMSEDIDSVLKGTNLRRGTSKPEREPSL